METGAGVWVELLRLPLMVVWCGVVGFLWSDYSTANFQGKGRGVRFVSLVLGLCKESWNWFSQQLFPFKYSFFK